MKKTLLAALCIVLLGACSQTPFDQVINLLNQTTKSIENCTTLDELQDVNQRYIDEFTGLQQQLPENLTEAQQAELNKASEAYGNAVAKKIAELGGTPQAVDDVEQGVEAFNAEPDNQGEGPDNEAGIAAEKVTDEAAATMN